MYILRKAADVNNLIQLFDFVHSSTCAPLVVDVVKTAYRPLPRDQFHAGSFQCHLPDIVARKLLAKHFPCVYRNRFLLLMHCGSTYLFLVCAFYRAVHSEYAKFMSYYNAKKRFNNIRKILNSGTLTFDEGYRPETSVMVLLCGTGMFLLIFLPIR